MSINQKPNSLECLVAKEMVFDFVSQENLIDFLCRKNIKFFHAY